MAKKFSPMRFTAATEAAALAGALQLVGATSEEAEYEVIENGPKGVTVRVKPRESAVEAAAPLAATEAAPARIQPVVAPPATVPRPDASITWAPQARESLPAQAEAVPAAAPPVEPVEEAAEVPTPQTEAQTPVALQSAAPFAPAPVEHPIDEETRQRAAALAREFLERMGLEGEVVVEEANGSAHVPLTIEGADVGILIGKRGQTLQAFQYLLNLTLNNGVAPEEGARVVVDAGKYRARRQSALEESARAGAARARREGRPVWLEPMPAYERRVVHTIIQEETEVSSSSQGREPSRRVVITPDGATAGPPRDPEERPQGQEGGRRGFGNFARRPSGGQDRGYGRGR